jgi:hypothetical protein
MFATKMFISIKAWNVTMILLAVIFIPGDEAKLAPGSALP